ncbi:hypothetical protein COE51_15240 [Bacillus pseudomycoides]|nr:hypothetical protein COE51_15240 [Bacillus pseudomycoides]
MIDFIGEIKKIEKEIENAAKDVATHVIDELQAAKKHLETEMQRTFLKTEVSFKINQIIDEEQFILRKNHDLFHDVCKELTGTAVELNQSFESRTGNEIKKSISGQLDKIRNQLISKQYDLDDSCGKK